MPKQLIKKIKIGKGKGDKHFGEYPLVLRNDTEVNIFYKMPNR